MLDGQAQEQVFYDGAADVSGNDPRQGDCRLPLKPGDPMPSQNASFCSSVNTMQTNSQDYVTAIADNLKAGIPVLSVDYALQLGNANFAYAQDRCLGLVGLVKMRSLEDLTATPP